MRAFRFSTRALAARDRCAVWSSKIDEWCCPCAIDYGSEPIHFQGDIELRTAAGLELLRVDQNSAGSRRATRHVARTDPAFYFLILQISGYSRMAQAGSEAQLSPGTMTLMDSGRPCSYAYAGSSVNLNLHIPRRMLDARRGTARLPLAAALNGATTTIMGDVMQAIFRQAAAPDAVASPGVAGALLGLAFETVLGTSAPIAPDASTLDRVQAYVLARLHEPALSPQSIAHALGFSIRHLHRLFEPLGQTLGDWLRERRLERCASDLRDPALRHVSVTEICYRWGFNDSAHFSRAFKAGFGQAPKSYRAANLRQ